MRASKVAALLLITLAGRAWALPIGFGVNQGSRAYSEIKTDNFILYHDARTPLEAHAAANALEHARPVLENWLKVKRGRPLPVVMSAVTDNASFANFITDAVELQTLGLGGRDLSWHEYTHSTMYRHLDNWLGPAGSVLHLPFMPAWWIEGLAESASRSVTSDVGAAIERHSVLHGTWPSFAKLHSLYGKNFSVLDGYAISGNFVSYILRTYDAQKLPKLLNDFFHYSMPWWWPWAAVPFNQWLPMDAALRNLTGKDGEQLYTEYKQAATAYWQKLGVSLLEEKVGASFGSSNALQVRGDTVYHAINDENMLKEVALTFDKGTGRWAESWETRTVMPAALGSFARAMHPTLKVYALESSVGNTDLTHELGTQVPGGPLVRHASIQGFLLNIFTSRDKVIWLEQPFDHTALCYAPLAPFVAGKIMNRQKDARCVVATTMPRSLQFLGETSVGDGKNGFFTSEIWLAEKEETLVGDRYKILRFSPDDGVLTTLSLVEGGAPVSMARSGNDLWVLVAQRNGRFLRQIDTSGKCREERTLVDHANRVLGLSDGRLLLPLYNGAKQKFLRIAPKDLPEQKCHVTLPPDSPLMYAMGHSGADFTSALKATDMWQPIDTTAAAETRQNIVAAAGLDAASPNTIVIPESQPAQWRGRPVFAVPWIGADAKGYQFGALSVPLMDQMQNETVRLSALYGMESRFPSTEVSLLSTRFDATYQIDVFRYQTFNGVYRDSEDDLTKVLYFDERGARVTRSEYVTSLRATVSAGVKSSTLLPYIGPNAVRHGHHNELFLDLSHSKRLGTSNFTLSSSIETKAVPPKVNENFEYNQVGVNSTLSRPIALGSWRTSSLSLGISGSRVRGTKPKRLKEVYRPLKTFVPGSGGGYNEINIGLAGPGALTSAQYGDTQARAKVAWTFPLIEDLETLIGILYLQRLDFTAFFNYGGAWTGPHPDMGRMIKAHGYNLDLSTDIKGITVATGVGVGQVIGFAPEAYFTFSFDALIN